MIRRFLILISLGFLICSLSGCGQTGRLYLPDSHTQQGQNP